MFFLFEYIFEKLIVNLGYFKQFLKKNYDPVNLKSGLTSLSWRRHGEDNRWEANGIRHKLHTIKRASTDNRRQRGEFLQEATRKSRTGS